MSIHPMAGEAGDDHGTRHKFLRIIRLFGLPSLEFADFVTNVFVTVILYQANELLWAALGTVFLSASAIYSAKIGAEPVKSDFEYNRHRNRLLYDSELYELHAVASPQEDANREEQPSNTKCSFCCVINAPAKLFNWIMCPNGICCGPCRIHDFVGPQLSYLSIQDMGLNTKLSKNLGGFLGGLHLWPIYFLGISIKVDEKRKVVDCSSKKNAEKVVYKEWKKEKRQDYAIHRFLGASLEACPQLFLQCYIWLGLIRDGAVVPGLLLISISISFASQIWALVEWWWCLFAGERLCRENNKRWAVSLFVLQFSTGLIAKVLMLAYFWVSMSYKSLYILFLMLPGRFIICTYWEKVSPFLVFPRLAFDFLLMKPFSVAVCAIILDFVEMILCLSLPSKSRIRAWAIILTVVLCWVTEKGILVLFAREYKSDGIFSIETEQHEQQGLNRGETDQNKKRQGVMQCWSCFERLPFRSKEGMEKNNVWVGLYQLWSQRKDEDIRPSDIEQRDKTGRHSTSRNRNESKIEGGQDSLVDGPITEQPHAV